MDNIKIIFYTTSSGKQPFVDWHKDLDGMAKSIIIARIARLRVGNFGDCKPLKNGAGVCELRIAYGSGLRIYYGKKGSAIIVLLAGGDKGSQNRDIARAKRYWQAYKELMHESE